MCAKIMQIESNIGQTCLELLSRCSLSYAKIMQIESNIGQTCLGLLPRCSLSYAKLSKSD